MREELAAETAHDVECVGGVFPTRSSQAAEVVEAYESRAGFPEVFHGDARAEVGERGEGAGVVEAAVYEESCSFAVFS